MTATSENRSPRRRGWAALIGVLVLAMVLVGVLLTRSRDDAPRVESPDAARDAGRATPGTTSSSAPTVTPTGAASVEPSKGPSPSAPSPTSEGERERAPAVGLDDAANPARDISVTITSIESVRSRAELPGELSRPALRVTLRVDNSGRKTARLGAPVANLYFGADRTPAISMRNPGSRPFPGAVRPASSVTGRFVFNVPRSDRNKIEIEVDLASGLRIVAFEGSAT